uniref:Protein twisted gastrulation n=1 Tax=Aceria tosichella TaxID=561515 RepID=A0A6G1SHQ0_9ACAR
MAQSRYLGWQPWISRLSILISIATLIVMTNLVFVSACPRMNCAPIISKCQLIDACRCEASLNYTCFKACSHCLGEYYSECCSCVGVCPKEDENDKSLESHVKVFESTNDELFDLFASDDDLSARWIIHHDKITSPNSTVSMNCTMAFLVSCVDMYKCESSCISMGASGYRWFHVGCCECVGKYCLNFGVNEIRCRNCPQDSEQVIDSSNDNL